MSITCIPGFHNSLHLSVHALFFQCCALLSQQRLCLMKLIRAFLSLKSTVGITYINCLIVFYCLLYVDREVSDCDNSSRHEIGHTFEHIFKLTYISWPAILREQNQSLWSNGKRTAEVATLSYQEMLYKQRQIIYTISQRRNVNG